MITLTEEQEKDPEIIDLINRYQRAMHSVQAGVKMTMAKDESDGIEPDRMHTSPKHLRVGVNSSLMETGVLTHLLVKKGIITFKEFLTNLAEMAESEKARYEEQLSERIGLNVRLGSKY
jgi:hypothetical protein